MFLKLINKWIENEYYDEYEVSEYVHTSPFP